MCPNSPVSTIRVSKRMTNAASGSMLATTRQRWRVSPTTSQEPPRSGGNSSSNNAFSYRKRHLRKHSNGVGVAVGSVSPGMTMALTIISIVLVSLLLLILGFVKKISNDLSAGASIHTPHNQKTLDPFPMQQEHLLSVSNVVGRRVSPEALGDLSERQQRVQNQNQLLPDGGLVESPGELKEHWKDVPASKKVKPSYLRRTVAGAGIGTTVLVENDSSLGHASFGNTTVGAPSCTAPTGEGSGTGASLSPEEVSFTLVTQLSEDRLWMLPHHCDRWDGPISVAVLTDLTVDVILDKIVEEVDAYNNEVNQHSSSNDVKMLSECYPDQVVVRVMSKGGVEPGEYPVNTLRNLALQGVETSHFLYVDVDFWAGETLYHALHSEFVQGELAEDSRLALVIPAFQIHRMCEDDEECRLESVSVMPRTKKDVISLVKEKRASVFDPTNRAAHGSTSYMGWAKMAEGDMLDIPCIKSNRYEPYLAVRYCSELPPFQEAFTGYGKNKVTQVMHMRRVGYEFSQLGGVFVVHYPHIASTDRMKWEEGKDIWNGVEDVPGSEAKEKVEDEGATAAGEGDIIGERGDSEDVGSEDVVTVKSGDEEEEGEEENGIDADGDGDGNDEGSDDVGKSDVIVKEHHHRGVDWSQYKRGQVDRLFVRFRTWLWEEVEDESRVPMCEDKMDDDVKLWI